MMTSNTVTYCKVNDSNKTTKLIEFYNKKNYSECVKYYNFRLIITWKMKQILVLLFQTYQL